MWGLRSLWVEQTTRVSCLMTSALLPCGAYLHTVFCLGRFCRARALPLFGDALPFLKAEMSPCPFEKKILYPSHMVFSSVLPFLLPTHSLDWCLFLQFTALKCPFDGPFTALKCPFDGPFTTLKYPFQMAPCPYENLGRTLSHIIIIIIINFIWTRFLDREETLFKEPCTIV